MNVYHEYPVQTDLKLLENVAFTWSELNEKYTLTVCVVVCVQIPTRYTTNVVEERSMRKMWPPNQNTTPLFRSVQLKVSMKLYFMPYELRIRLCERENSQRMNWERENSVLKNFPKQTVGETCCTYFDGLGCGCFCYCLGGFTFTNT